MQEVWSAVMLLFLIALKAAALGQNMHVPKRLRVRHWLSPRPGTTPRFEDTQSAVNVLLADTMPYARDLGLVSRLLVPSQHYYLAKNFDHTTHLSLPYNTNLPTERLIRFVSAANFLSRPQTLANENDLYHSLLTFPFNAWVAREALG